MLVLVKQVNILKVYIPQDCTCLLDKKHGNWGNTFHNKDVEYLEVAIY